MWGFIRSDTLPEKRSQQHSSKTAACFHEEQPYSLIHSLIMSCMGVLSRRRSAFRACPWSATNFNRNMNQGCGRLNGGDSGHRSQAMPSDRRFKAAFCWDDLQPMTLVIGGTWEEEEGIASAVAILRMVVRFVPSVKWSPYIIYTHISPDAAPTPYSPRLITRNAGTTIMDCCSRSCRRSNNLTKRVKLARKCETD